MITIRGIVGVLTSTMLAAGCGESAPPAVLAPPAVAAATLPPPGSERLVVFISDLHLGVGKNPNGEWHPYEDFRWAYEFKLFLQRVDREGAGRADLVLNGDTFELWQSLEKDCLYSNPNLGCTESEALKRVARVIGQHRDELNALGTFAASGSNTVTIVPGNHDAVLLFSGVARAVVAAIPAPTGRLSVPATGYWLSPDGLVYAEHGHQIGAEVNRFEGWPRPFMRHARGLSVRRPWGEQFVQSYYNDFEANYPIVDNVSDEHEAMRLAMAAEGGFKAAADSADFIRFFLLGVSWRQFGQSLRDEGKPPEWDVAKIQKEGGTQFIIDSFPTGDPLRRELERRAATKGLPLSAAVLSPQEIRAICDQRAAMIAQAKDSPPRGVKRCSQTDESLGAAYERLTQSRNEIFSQHLKQTRTALGQTTQRFLLVVYSHTHQVDTGFNPLQAENLGWDPRVVNTGAWQRVVSPATLRSWNLSPAEALRKSVESLPPCYSVVWVAPYKASPAADVRSWRQQPDGSWDFGTVCDE
jgi:hypothetical protein